MREDTNMFEIGDMVRKKGTEDVLSVTGTGPEGFYRVQKGNDGASTLSTFNRVTLSSCPK
jgi:hypothetical protein